MSTNEGKVILVVGGACGMGAETVCRLYREGAKLVVLDLNAMTLTLVAAE